LIEPNHVGHALSRMIAGLILVAAPSVHPAWAQDHELPPDAVAVLQRFLGEWETEATLRLERDPPREIHTRGLGTCRRTLAGRWFEFRTRTIPPGEAELQIMTFDAEAGVYRQWVFSSDGYSHVAQGTWDPDTSTLRWSGKAAGGSFVIVDHFVSPEQLDWTLRRVADDGRVVQTIEGRLIRVGVDKRTNAPPSQRGG